MPLIELAGEAALSYMFARGADAALTRGLPAVRKFYSEKIIPWWKWSLADFYLSLTGIELQRFYKNEEPIEVFLGNQSVSLRATMACKPKHDGDLDTQSIKFSYSEEYFSLPQHIDAYTKPVKKKLRNTKGSLTDMLFDWLASRPILRMK